MNRRATQQCNMSPYVYAVYWLPPASSAFLLARKCNWLAEKMLMTCVMRHARLQKLQRFRRKMPFYSFLILWSEFWRPKIDVQMRINGIRMDVYYGRLKQLEKFSWNDMQSNFAVNLPFIYLIIVKILVQFDGGLVIYLQYLLRING